MLYPSLIDRLKNQHETIEQLIRSVDKERLYLQPQPGKWSIHDNITHLAKYQPIFVERIQRILKEDRPSFGRYQAQEDPAFEPWRKKTTDELLKIMQADRKDLFNLITTLGEDQLKRVGVHKKYGALSIIGWTEFFVLHEAHHIFTIFQLANDTELK